MRIIFTRHGESLANITHTISNRNLPHTLTSNGRAQAVFLAERLQSIPIREIYTSPVLRAIETSSIIGERLGIEPIVEDGLREFDCGILEGHSDDAAWQQWEELIDAWIIHHRYDHSIEGGESFCEVQNRFVPFIQKLESEFGDSHQNLLCISHGGIYSIMLPLVLRNVDQALITKYGFAYTCILIAEYMRDQLLCIEWDGHPISKTYPIK